MRLKALVFGSLGLRAAACQDWTARSYDAIIVGAGPAGIIGLGL
jgi:hypothetical protein